MISSHLELRCFQAFWFKQSSFKNNGLPTYLLQYRLMEESSPRKPWPYLPLRVNQRNISADHMKNLIPKYCNT